MARTRKRDMTIAAGKKLQQLLAGETHPAPCQCPACLYSEYLKIKKGRGRPIAKYMFFLDWLIWRVKMEALAEEFNYSPVTCYFSEEEAKQHPGSLTWQEYQAKYKKAPYVRQIRQIFDSLVEQGFEEACLLDYAVVCLYKARGDDDRFVKLIDRLQQIRANAPYNDPKKKKEIWTTWYGPKFVRRVGLFIHAQPKKQITRRALLRHFSNKREKDLSDIRGLLANNFQIIEERRGKSIVYRVINLEKNAL